MPSEGRQGQWISILATALTLVFALAVSGGCTSGGDESATASAGGGSASASGSGSGSDESYPNLGDVPERPVTMTEEQRAQLEQGLVADSQQREYSEEVIAFQAEPAEPLPAPMETGAGDAAASELGDVTMPGAVTPPFSGGEDPAPDAPAAPTATTSTPSSVPSAPAVPSTPPAPTTPSVPPAPSTAATAAAAAQASPSNIPVPPEDPMARATTPPFSGGTGAVPSSPIPPSPVPPVPPASTPPAYTPPAVASTSTTATYTPVPDAPAALGGDADTSNLNRAQLDALRPSTPPFSGAAAASGAPTQLSGPTPDISTPPAPAAAAPPAYAAPEVTTAYAAPVPAPSAYAPPPPAVPPPAVGVQEVFQARLVETLPSAPVAPLPSAGDLGGDEPLTTVVVSSRGVASFEELPVNVPVLEREPVPAAAAGGGRGGTLARRAVPGSSVKVATILFADGSASLREREKEIVREVYERYLSGGRKVRVVGHSSSRTRNMDPVRHRMVNFGISAERANVVAKELQRLGVPSEQITVVAAADDMPMYYEVMPSGEAGNRRTEIYLD